MKPYLRTGTYLIYDALESYKILIKKMKTKKIFEKFIRKNSI